MNPFALFYSSAFVPLATMVLNSQIYNRDLWLCQRHPMVVYRRCVKTRKSSTGIQKRLWKVWKFDRLRGVLDGKRSLMPFLLPVALYCELVLMRLNCTARFTIYFEVP